MAVTYQQPAGLRRANLHDRACRGFSFLAVDSAVAGAMVAARLFYGPDSRSLAFDEYGIDLRCIGRNASQVESFAQTSGD